MATVPVQVLAEIEKSALPLIPTLEKVVEAPAVETAMLNDAVLVSVTLPKAKGEGTKVRTATGATPVPLREMVCGLPVALSVYVSVAVSRPAAVGANVMAVEQDDGTLPVQVLEPIEKSVEPVRTSLEKVTAPPEVLVFIGRVELAVSVTLPKLRLVGLKVSEVALPTWKLQTFAVSGVSLSLIELMNPRLAIEAVARKA